MPFFINELKLLRALNSKKIDFKMNNLNKHTMISRIHKSTVLTFRLQENVSVANALRRTILSDIETPILKDVRVSKNTSRFTNELIAQRLGCVPVVKDASIGMEVSLNVKNTTEEILMVTTQDLSVSKLFPPSIYGEKEWYIDLLRLRPAIANIPGEEISLTCVVGLGKAKESGQYNVVSTCSYAMTQNQAASDEAFASQDDSKENWDLLEAKRFVEPDSFDFIVQTVGVFTNEEIVVKACDVIIQSLHEVVFHIEPSLTTMKDCSDLIIVDGDYTIGKLLEYEIFKQHGKTISYVTFLKKHPHDSNGILRVATIGVVDLTVLVSEAAHRLSEIFVKIKHSFGGTLEKELQDDLEQFKAADIESKREILQSKGRAADLVAKADEETLNDMAAAYSEEVAVKRKRKSKKEKPAE
jgi:DNA-directed RNA polymerase subunit L